MPEFGLTLPCFSFPECTIFGTALALDRPVKKNIRISEIMWEFEQNKILVFIALLGTNSQFDWLIQGPYKTVSNLEKVHWIPVQELLYLSVF